MRSLARNLRYGFRGLLRSPGFTSVAVLTLALGVGAGAAIFSIANGLLLNSVPWKDPATVVSFEVRKRGVDVDPRGATPAQYVDWKRQTTAFEDLFASRWEQAYLTDRDEPRQVVAPRATPNGFELLGIRALHGRTLTPQDAEPGAPRVIMLAERLWQERYAGDPRIVGQSVELNGEPVTVVGVVSAEQWYPFPQAEVVQPLEVNGATASRSDQRYGVSGRLQRGATLQQAQAEMDVIMARLGEQYPETDGELGVQMLLTRDRIAGASGRRGIYVLMGAVGFVLLIVCANLANLLLTRAAGREKEIATRAALGATRGQIMLQLLAECAAIGLLALPLALLVTRWSLDYFLSLVPDTVTFMDQFFRMDGNVVAFAVAITGLTVLLFGLSPALRSSKPDLSESLKEGGSRGGTSGSSGRLRSALVVVQIGLALSLLVTSSLFMQALNKLFRVDPGFELAGAMSFQVLLPEERYRDVASSRDFYRRMEQALSGLPGNGRAAIVSNAPLDWDGPWRDFQIAGRARADNEEAPRARWTSASAGYLDTLGLRVLAGRGLQPGDRENGQPVAVVSQSLVDKYFRGQNPVGQRIEVGAFDGFGFVTGGTRQIVGVVADIKTFSGLRAPLVEPRMYEPLQQQPPNAFFIVARSAGDPLAAAPVLRERLRQLDPHLSPGRLQSMRTGMDNRMWSAIFFAKLMAILGGLALVLAGVGVFGVVSYATAKRTREFGIRAALGAEPRQIALLVLRKTASLAGYGVALGLVLALLLERVTRAMLFETDGRDPATLLSISLLLIAISAAAAAAPTLRATRVNPMQSLREE